MGHLSSKSGVQQGDPLGPLLFALVLHKVISAIDADDECLNLLYQAWHMDDGVLAGKRSAVISCTFLDNGAWPFTWLGGQHWEV